MPITKTPSTSSRPSSAITPFNKPQNPSPADIQFKRNSLDAAASSRQIQEVNRSRSDTINYRPPTTQTQTAAPANSRTPTWFERQMAAEAEATRQRIQADKPLPSSQPNYTPTTPSVSPIPKDSLTGRGGITPNNFAPNTGGATAPRSLNSGGEFLPSGGRYINPNSASGRMPTLGGGLGPQVLGNVAGELLQNWKERGDPLKFPSPQERLGIPPDNFEADRQRDREQLKQLQKGLERAAQKAAEKLQNDLDKLFPPYGRPETNGPVLPPAPTAGQNQTDYFCNYTYQVAGTFLNGAGRPVLPGPIGGIVIMSQDATGTSYGIQHRDGIRFLLFAYPDWTVNFTLNPTRVDGLPDIDENPAPPPDPIPDPYPQERPYGLLPPGFPSPAPSDPTPKPKTPPRPTSPIPTPRLPGRQPRTGPKPKPTPNPYPPPYAPPWAPPQPIPNNPPSPTATPSAPSSVSPSPSSTTTTTNTKKPELSPSGSPKPDPQKPRDPYNNPIPNPPMNCQDPCIGALQEGQQAQKQEQDKKKPVPVTVKIFRDCEGDNGAARFTDQTINVPADEADHIKLLYQQLANANALECRIDVTVAIPEEQIRRQPKSIPEMVLHFRTVKKQQNGKRYNYSMTVFHWNKPKGLKPSIPRFVKGSVVKIVVLADGSRLSASGKTKQEANKIMTAILRNVPDELKKGPSVLSKFSSTFTAKALEVEVEIVRGKYYKTGYQAGILPDWTIEYRK